MFDYLNQNEPNVNAFRAKRAARNHNPLALVANSYACPSSSRSSQQYYVTHPPSVQDYDDDYQGKIQGYSSKKNYGRKFHTALHPKWRANVRQSSDEECLTFRSEDGEYAMAVRNFKKFFKRRGRCGDPNHLIGECPKPSKDKNQRDLVGGSWSDSSEEDDEKVKDETCLMAHTSSERNKGVVLECLTCQTLRIDNEKLKEEAFKLTQFQKSTHSLNEMLSFQKPSGDKSGLGFNSFEASTSETKEMKFVKSQNETSSGGALPIAKVCP
ncbi:hypothetical protein Tco_1080423 [Tanacetum coccineum]|uniref:Alpha/beta hydrolases superfamily protein n=1 Tax=Tanacetum coccineum TaxID=301880 RepID=A0ABQ5HUM9_9ASTR